MICIIIELYKILELNNFYKIIHNEELLSILKLIFPEFKNIYRLKNYYLLKDFIKKDIILFLAVLIMDETNDYEYFFHKYKISNKIKDNLIILNRGYKNFQANNDFFKKDVKSNLYKFSQKNMAILYTLNILDKKKLLLWI